LSNTDNTVTLPLNSSRLQVRMAVSAFFFCQGVSFMSWASRIPDFKAAMHLNEAQLANILWALPVGQLLTMFFSGRAVTRFGSKAVIRIVLVCYALTLTGIGLSAKPWHLAFGLFIFGICGNMCNIAVNTQGINAEAMYGKSIMSSFHGVWSVAGFTGALTGSLMIKLHASPWLHFCIIASLVIIMVIIFNRYLLYTATSKSASSFKKIKMPEKMLVKLGIIGFCCLSCEGCMFDWSGIYMKQVVKAEGGLVSLGLASFMIMMATGRFAGDWLATKFSRKHIVQVSGVLIFCGMMLAVLLPYFISTIIGFFIVGLGVSTIIPMLYSTVGKFSKTAKGIAIATVSSIGFLGFLMGPPLIGYIAELSGLQYSFVVIAFFGLAVSILISQVKEIS
jgi:MFS family permease